MFNRIYNFRFNVLLKICYDFLEFLLSFILYFKMNLLMKVSELYGTSDFNAYIFDYVLQYQLYCIFIIVGSIYLIKTNSKYSELVFHCFFYHYFLSTIPHKEFRFFNLNIDFAF